MTPKQFQSLAYLYPIKPSSCSCCCSKGITPSPHQAKVPPAACQRLDNSDYVGLIAVILHSLDHQTKRLDGLNDQPNTPNGDERKEGEMQLWND